jgi:hypothetical protein
MRQAQRTNRTQQHPVVQPAPDEARIDQAVSTYIQWRKALEHANALQQEIHAQVRQMSEAQFTRYAERTLQYDTDHDK